MTLFSTLYNSLKQGLTELGGKGRPACHNTHKVGQRKDGWAPIRKTPRKALGMSLIHYHRRGESSIFFKEACCREEIFNTGRLCKQAQHLQEVRQKYHHNVFQASFPFFHQSLTHISHSFAGWCTAGRTVGAKTGPQNMKLRRGYPKRIGSTTTTGGENVPVKLLKEEQAVFLFSLSLSLCTVAQKRGGGGA